MAQVVVVATITPVPEHRDAVREIFREAVAQVHGEPGCELYALHENADGFVMIEQWTTSADLDAHSRGAVLAAVGPQLDGKLAAAPALVLLSAVPAGDPAKGVLVG